jgi:molecular chaperone DnaJ
MIFFYDLKLSFVAAILGGKIEVPTLKGTTVVKIPEGTQHGKVLRLKGLGAPDIKHKQPGDQLVRVNIQLPTKLTPRQKELLTAFAHESGMSPDGQGEGLFDKVKNLFD